MQRKTRDLPVSDLRRTGRVALTRYLVHDMLNLAQSADSSAAELTRAEEPAA